MVFLGLITTVWHLSIGGHILYQQAQSLTQTPTSKVLLLNQAVDRHPALSELQDYTESKSDSTSSVEDYYLKLIHSKHCALLGAALDG